MGRVIVDCLLRLNHKVTVIVADRAEPSFPLAKGVKFEQVDLRNHKKLVQLLRNHSIVINSTSHHFNLPVMRAALEAHTHYLDLGGLFHFTRRQLKLHEAFRSRQLIGILGMGCAPGISNLLAKWAAQKMDRVEQIHIKVGGRTWGTPPPTLPYAIGTIREELTLKPSVYEKGRWLFKAPRSGVEWFEFPSPVGRQKIFCTIHSEVASLPLSFHGLKNATFKIGFSD